MLGPGEVAAGDQAGAEGHGEKSNMFRCLFACGRFKNPRGRSPITPNVRSSARPARPIVPSSNSLPISVTPCGTLLGGENFGSGAFGSGAQSLRASETSTKPARSVSDGCPVELVIVRISSRSEGTSNRSTWEKMRAISTATLRRSRSA